MQIIAIGGKPGCGKTTLLKALLKTLEPGQPFTWGRLIKGRFYPNARLVILGVYDARPFSGTDRLSMAVVPEMICWLESESDPAIQTVVFEGDRLYTDAVLHVARKTRELITWELTAPDDVLHQRYTKRGSHQNGAWLKGRETKITRLREVYHAQLKQHETPDDTTRLVQELRGLIDDRHA